MPPWAYRKEIKTPQFDVLRRLAKTTYSYRTTTVDLVGGPREDVTGRFTFLRLGQGRIIRRFASGSGGYRNGGSRKLLMDKLCRWPWIATVTAALVGCRGVSPPNWSHPGTAVYQQSQAEQFDPYPENEIGPQIVGARPRE